MTAPRTSSPRRCRRSSRGGRRRDRRPRTRRYARPARQRARAPARTRGGAPTPPAPPDGSRTWPRGPRSPARRSRRPPRRPPAARDGRRARALRDLHVVVQRELPRVGAQADGIDLLLALVLDPGLDQVLGEHVALEQELVVLLKGVEGVAERGGDGWGFRQLLRRQLEQGPVHRQPRGEGGLGPVPPPPHHPPESGGR